MYIFVGVGVCVCERERECVYMNIHIYIFIDANTFEYIDRCINMFVCMCIYAYKDTRI